MEKTEMNIKNKFRKRASRLRYGGYLILSIIIISLGVGAWIFFIAGDITRSDVTGKIMTLQGVEDKEKSIETKLKKLEGKKPIGLVEYETKLSNINKNVRDIHNEVSVMITDVIGGIDKQTSKNEISLIPGFVRVSDILDIQTPEILIKRDVHNFNIPQFTIRTKNYIVGINLVKSAPNLKEKIQEKVNQIAVLELKRRDLAKNNQELINTYEVSSDYKKMDSLYDEREELKEGREIIRKRQLNQKFGNIVNPGTDPLNVSNTFLIQTNITRFGALLLILFFVGILVNLYRYNVRLAGYYDARADSLEMLEMDFDKESFTRLVTSVSPEQYDFGKNPSSPTDQAIDIVHKISNKFKSS